MAWLTDVNHFKRRYVRQAKGAERLEPKRHVVRNGRCIFVRRRCCTTGVEAEPKPSAMAFLRNVVSPYSSRKGRQTVRKADGCAGMGWRRKRMPSGNGRDRG